MALSETEKERIKAASDKTFPFVERCGVRTLDVERGYCRMMMPLEPNLNHVGIMYAGALYTLAELPGGVIYLSSFDVRSFYPIVKDMRIRFRRPATTDITVEVRLDDSEIERIQTTAAEQGKCDFEWETELKDAHGEVVAISHNLYQLRRIGH
ncbi:PaaI family thioesterase [Alloalcanivorax gelatiniphagus]|uniref:DUF4442 domain-containing protein n=1 Tax=Alloalcanivorax gelatiniphagus TaxID=1194167 RepID=A0ABY2XIW2_9GAMM|nr:YiiD C-terminal domain-containing protein [Alloalcanivorax gelatiniphagus]TMW11837.1 DUF4442 domain-containing protein [Alloalcanivorax gelatiniphagus]|tara:strand:+ start:2443 stop:2901 length:459 start_codon:yes stop_codon:yes gene_type:complete